jgi:subtilisin-like proprotein convertase family protein
MNLTFSRHVARLTRSLLRRPAPRPAARLGYRPVLEGLEDRALPSTVFRATDVPQRVDFPDVFTTSSIDVPQSLTIASLKVQLNVAYPLDNDLTIDLIAPDGTDVPLSSFEGTGANFQNTVFSDAAATPIGAGNSPFAGAYQPEGSLSRLAGMNAQGTWQLQIIDWGASSGTLNSWSLIIQPAGNPVPAASSFVVSGFPSSTTAGQVGSFTVTARDANGNVATGYTGTVHFTSSDPYAGLPADYTFTAADAGTHTFSTTLTTAGMQSLTTSDTAASGLTGTEAGIAVSAAAASRLVVSAPAGATARMAFNVTVTARDAYGNTATGYTGTVHFTSSDGQAVLPVNSTLRNGTGTFSVTLKTAGSQTLSATDTTSSTVTGNAAVSVSPAVSGAQVFHATDVPQALNPSEVFVSSVINVPQSVTIASLKVQVNITYPLDGQLRIDLVHIDNAGFLRSVLTLSDFVGAGANFQDTIFDDAAATPIAAGAPPFAGSYRPSDPLSALAGQNAQGTWVLEVGDFAGGSGTVNSWSLTIQPAGGLNAVAGSGGTPRQAPAPLPLAALAVGNTSVASQPDTGAAGHARISAVALSAAPRADVPVAVGSDAVGGRPIVAAPAKDHARKALFGSGGWGRPADSVNDNPVL